MKWCHYLLSESAVRNGLSAELYLKRVSAWLSWRVHDADCAVTVVDDVDVDVTLYIAADATCDSTLPGFRRVQIDDALFTDRNCRSYGV